MTPLGESDRYDTGKEPQHYCLTGKSCRVCEENEEKYLDGIKEYAEVFIKKTEEALSEN